MSEPIVEIIATTLLPTDERSWGCVIDGPVTGSSADVYSVTILGWVLGKSSPLAAVEIVYDDRVYRTIQPMPRPDVLAAFPQAAEQKAGIHASISVLGLLPEFELNLQAVLKDETRVPLGKIRGRHRAMKTSFQPKLQPLMMTSLGRTGSTWMTHLLASHEQIVGYRPFQCEPRVTSYWMNMLRDVAEPSSFLQSLGATDVRSPRWWLGDQSSVDVPTIPAFDSDPDIRRWLGRESIETFAAACQTQVDNFYAQAAAKQDRSRAVYFVEKYVPNRIVPGVVLELYPKAKEVVLVRDFRDMVVSIFAFSKKLGFPAFGREKCANDEEFIRDVGQRVERLVQYWKQRKGEAHLVRYEDLVLNPEPTLKKIFEYLKIDATDEAVSRTHAVATDRGRTLQKGHQTASSPASSIGRWKAELPAKLLDLSHENFGPMLTELGYSIDEAR